MKYGKRLDFAVGLVLDTQNTLTRRTHLDRSVFYIAHFNHFSFRLATCWCFFSFSFSSNPVNKLGKLVEDLKSGGKLNLYFEWFIQQSKNNKPKKSTNNKFFCPLIRLIILEPKISQYRDVCFMSNSSDRLSFFSLQIQMFEDDLHISCLLFIFRFKTLCQYLLRTIFSRWKSNPIWMSVFSLDR